MACSNLAERCKQYLSNGSLVSIEDRLHSLHREDQKGNRHCVTEIDANVMIIFDKLPENNNFEANIKNTSNCE